ncbi:unnamed protein product [Polarella glacialis]|uniref:Uncharacterized protein n=1 Tax=Polarella glacialis TaxID=89957 RepID=A0A813HIA4_POLGL|nr:unnamed protein product [Polarella glacialis]
MSQTVSDSIRLASDNVWAKSCKMHDIIGKLGMPEYKSDHRTATTLAAVLDIATKLDIGHGALSQLQARGELKGFDETIQTEYDELAAVIDAIPVMFSVDMAVTTTTRMDTWSADVLAMAVASMLAVYA